MSGVDILSVETTIDSGAGIITMTDGMGGNRLNPVIVDNLTTAIETHASSNDVRFILLRSNGPNFSLGMDLDAFSDETDADGDTSAFCAASVSYAALLNTIHSCPKTVVGLIEGPVKAGGIGIAAACDVVVASDSANFELSELLLGLIPANVMPYLLARMSVKRAAYMVQTAACIDAVTAMNWGLVDELHPAEKIEKALKQLGRRLMRISPEAAARQKSFVQRLRSVPLEQQGKISAEELVSAAFSSGVQAAVKGFTDGELPPWFKKFRPEISLSIMNTRK